MRKTAALPVCIILMATSVAALCGSPRPRLLCAEYSQEGAVVAAKLVRTRHITPANPNEDDYYLLTMQAQRVLRGRIGARFRVYEGNNSGRAGFEWRKGESYLLFISYIKEQKGWALDGCGNSGPMDGSAEILKNIEQLQTGGHGGTIQGNVWGDGGPTILAKGPQGLFRAVADKEGNFEIHVPAGVYSAMAILEGRRFRPADMSYEDPKRFRIRSGGCAQIQFEPIEDSQKSRLNRAKESQKAVVAVER